MAINFRVEVQGLKELKRACTGTGLYQSEYREAALAIGALGEAIAARSAPSGATGQLEARINHGVAKGPLPGWIAVRSTARRRSRKYPRGYFYGRLLNYSRIHGHFGWFTTPLKRLGTQVGPILSKAARQVEQNWGLQTK